MAPTALSALNVRGDLKQLVRRQRFSDGGDGNKIGNGGNGGDEGNGNDSGNGGNNKSEGNGKGGDGEDKEHNYPSPSPALPSTIAAASTSAPQTTSTAVTTIPTTVPTTVIVTSTSAAAASSRLMSGSVSALSNSPVSMNSFHHGTTATDIYRRPICPPFLQVLLRQQSCPQSHFSLPLHIHRIQGTALIQVGISHIQARVQKIIIAIPSLSSQKSPLRPQQVSRPDHPQSSMLIMRADYLQLQSMCLSHSELLVGDLQMQLLVVRLTKNFRCFS